MGLRINTNLSSLGAQRQFSINQSTLSKTLERLSTGMRINRAADDAAGLAISENMRTQIRGFSKALENAQDGINLIQTAESGIEQTTNILQRMRELAIQAANDTNTHDDRQKIQAEIVQLRDELTRLSQTTEFNTRKLLDGSLQNSRIGEAASAEIVQNVRAGNTLAQRPDMRNFIAGIQAMTTNVTVDSAIILKIISTASPVSPNQIGMEVYSSVLGLLTTVPDISRMPSSSFGISLNALTGNSGVLTLNLNKGGFLSGAVDRNTSFTNLMAVNRIAAVAAGTMTINVGGVPYSINIDPNVDTINSVITALTALSGGNYTFTASFNDVTSRFTLQVVQQVTTVLAPATASYTDVGLGAPVAFGPTGFIAGPPPNSPPGVVWPNPANPPAINTSLTFGGTSGLASALYLPFVGNPADVRLANYTGTFVQTAFAPPNDIYDLTTNETHRQTDTAIATSTQPVGDTFQISDTDIGKVAMIHVTARRDPVTVDNALAVHVGANEGQSIRLGIDELSAKALRLEDITVVGDPTICKNNPDTADFLQAEEAIGVLDNALDYVQIVRTRLGAIQNKLQFTISNLQVSFQNLTTSESRIRDTDMAAETTALTRAQILVQAGTAILSQANVVSQSALGLLNGR